MVRRFLNRSHQLPRLTAKHVPSRPASPPGPRPQRYRQTLFAVSVLVIRKISKNVALERVPLFKITCWYKVLSERPRSIKITWTCNGGCARGVWLFRSILSSMKFSNLEKNGRTGGSVILTDQTNRPKIIFLLLVRLANLPENTTGV